MSNVDSTQKLKGKGLITIGIFSANYFVLALVSNMLGGLHAIVWFLSPAVAALICGIPYMILTAKVRKPFAVFVMAVVVGLLFIATGQFHMLVPVTFIVGAIIAEIFRYATKYKSFFADSVGFAFFSLGMVASPLPLWLDPDSFIARIKEFGMPQSYVDTVTSLTSTGMLIIMIVATIVCSFIGAFIANALFKKHFKKAGVVA